MYRHWIAFHISTIYARSMYCCYEYEYGSDQYEYEYQVLHLWFTALYTVATEYTVNMAAFTIVDRMT